MPVDTFSISALASLPEQTQAQANTSPLPQNESVLSFDSMLAASTQPITQLEPVVRIDEPASVIAPNVNKLTVPPTVLVEAVVAAINAAISITAIKSATQTLSDNTVLSQDPDKTSAEKLSQEIDETWTRDLSEDHILDNDTENFGDTRTLIGPGGPDALILQILDTSLANKNDNTQSVNVKTSTRTIEDNYTKPDLDISFQPPVLLTTGAAQNDEVHKWRLDKNIEHDSAAGKFSVNLVLPIDDHQDRAGEKGQNDTQLNIDKISSATLSESASSKALQQEGAQTTLDLQILSMTTSVISTMTLPRDNTESDSDQKLTHQINQYDAHQEKKANPTSKMELSFPASAMDIEEIQDEGPAKTPAPDNNGQLLHLLDTNFDPDAELESFPIANKEQKIDVSTESNQQEQKNIALALDIGLMIKASMESIELATQNLFSISQHHSNELIKPKIVPNNSDIVNRNAIQSFASDTITPTAKAELSIPALDTNTKADIGPGATTSQVVTLSHDQNHGNQTPNKNTPRLPVAAAFIASASAYMDPTEEGQTPEVNVNNQQLIFSAKEPESTLEKLVNGHILEQKQAFTRTGSSEHAGSTLEQERHHLPIQIQKAGNPEVLPIENISDSPTIDMTSAEEERRVRRDARPRQISEDIRIRALERQVVTAVREGANQIRMQLYPPGMGQVLIRLVLDGAKLRLQFKTSSSEATSSLQDVEEALRHALSDNGFTITSFDVSDNSSEADDERRRKLNIVKPTPREQETLPFSFELQA
jgi:hypothetical protein